MHVQYSMGKIHDKLVCLYEVQIANIHMSEQIKCNFFVVYNGELVVYDSHTRRIKHACMDVYTSIENEEN